MDGFQIMRTQQAVRRDAIARGHRATTWSAIVSTTPFRWGSKCRGCKRTMWWAGEKIAGPLADGTRCPKEGTV